MRKIFLILFFCGFWVHAQSPAGIWYFGNKAGINFNLGVNPVNLNNSQMQTFEGCATLCNSFGNLLFYTDGIKVWNRNHSEMPNGTGLFGDSSSTQSAIIVPIPDSTTLYYIFTVDELANPNGLSYSIVDMTLDNGLGDLSQKNIQILTPTLEKINVVKHFNENDYWLITHKFGNNEFYSYKISSNGIDNPIISAVGEIVSGDDQNTIGYLKSSPNGKFLACANSKINSSNVQLFNFNNLTGQIGLIGTSTFQNDINGIGVYGLEFSNDSNLLYVSNIDYKNSKSQLFQFNIESENETIINNSRILIDEYFSDNFGTGAISALQLAPNKKIYIARNNSNYLSVIDNPDIYGLGCNYIQNGFSLGSNKSYSGLPAFITSFFDVSFNYTDNCFGEQTSFFIPSISNVINISWDFGDPSSPNNNSNSSQPTHQFTQPGTYNVTLTVTTTTNSKTFSRPVTIYLSPQINQPTNYNLCEENNNSAEFDLNTKDIEILGTQSASDYQVSYHLSFEDADNNENKLSSNYTNVSNPQTIYARLQAGNAINCYQIVSFDLIVHPNPTLLPDEEITYCLNYYPDTITLTAGNLNPSENLSYIWSNGATSESIGINEIGVYSVTATNQYNCSSTRTITVNSSEIATFNFVLDGEIGNYNLIITPNSTGNYVYALDNSEGTYQVSNTFLSITPGDHTIFVKDLNGCGIASDEFSVIGYPKYFTPNDDGYNDLWNLSGSYINLKKLLIYDRFGKLLYDLKPNDLGWDGTYKGKKMPSSDYWFHAFLESGEEIKGHFSLKR